MSSREQSHSRGPQLDADGRREGELLRLVREGLAVAGGPQAGDRVRHEALSRHVLEQVRVSGAATPSRTQRAATLAPRGVWRAMGFGAGGLALAAVAAASAQRLLAPAVEGSTVQVTTVSPLGGTRPPQPAPIEELGAAAGAVQSNATVIHDDVISGKDGDDSAPSRLARRAAPSTNRAPPSAPALPALGPANRARPKPSSAPFPKVGTEPGTQMLPAPASASASVDGAAQESLAAPAPEPRLSAGELLVRARSARRASWSLAIPLYQLLVRDFPDSSEAAVAELTLAERAAHDGNAEQALHWYRRYQRRAGAPLLAEALWGEAEALGRLGRSVDAERVLRHLAAQHASTPYGGAARARLLGGTGGSPP